MRHKVVILCCVIVPSIELRFSSEFVYTITGWVTHLFSLKLKLKQLARGRIQEIFFLRSIFIFETRYFQKKMHSTSVYFCIT